MNISVPPFRRTLDESALGDAFVLAGTGYTESGPGGDAPFLAAVYGVRLSRLELPGQRALAIGWMDKDLQAED